MDLDQAKLELLKNGYEIACKLSENDIKSIREFSEKLVNIKGTKHFLYSDSNIQNLMLELEIKQFLKAEKKELFQDLLNPMLVNLLYVDGAHLVIIIPHKNLPDEVMAIIGDGNGSWSNVPPVVLEKWYRAIVLSRYEREIRKERSNFKIVELRKG